MSEHIAGIRDILQSAAKLCIERARNLITVDSDSLNAAGSSDRCSLRESSRTKSSWSYTSKDRLLPVGLNDLLRIHPLRTKTLRFQHLWQVRFGYPIAAIADLIKHPTADGKAEVVKVCILAEIFCDRRALKIMDHDVSKALALHTLEQLPGRCGR